MKAFFKCRRGQVQYERAMVRETVCGCMDVEGCGKMVNKWEGEEVDIGNGSVEDR